MGQAGAGFTMPADPLRAADDVRQCKDCVEARRRMHAQPLLKAGTGAPAGRRLQAHARTNPSCAKNPTGAAEPAGQGKGAARRTSQPAGRAEGAPWQRPSGCRARNGRSFPLLVPWPTTDRLTHLGHLRQPSRRAQQGAHAPEVLHRGRLLEADANPHHQVGALRAGRAGGRAAAGGEGRGGEGWVRGKGRNVEG